MQLEGGELGKGGRRLVSKLGFAEHVQLNITDQ